MRKVLMFGAATALTGFAATAMAETFVITDDETGVPVTQTIKDPTLTEVPEVAGGPNEGFTYARRWAGLDGFEAYEGHIAAGGSINSHDVPATYLLYVVSGTGDLFMEDDKGTVLETVPYKPNDLIAFGPGTMHSWSNGGEEMVFIGFMKP